MFTNKIGKKTALDIAKFVLKEKSPYLKMPLLEQFVEDVLTVISYPKLCEEFRNSVNNGNVSNSVRIAYEDSGKFSRFLSQHFPTVAEVDAFRLTNYVRTDAGGLEPYSKV